MNLSELSELLERSTDVLRVETLGSYLSDSDRDWLDAYLRGDPKPDVELKRPWLDRLARAAERGHPWRRLRVIPYPTTDYFRYQCEWSYLDNTDAGEDIRVVDDVDWRHLSGSADPEFAAGDFYVADDQVVHMVYDDGRFTRAYVETDDMLAAMYLHGTEHIWTAYSGPFVEWWADSPELHRDVTV